MELIKFHLPDEENGYLSNRYMRDFTADGVKYSCVEQYMMVKKALLFGDADVASKIMASTDHQEMQDLGRTVKGFDSDIWNGHKQLIVYRGVYEKFSQNRDLAEKLISSGNALPVYCGENDRIWGIGLSMDNPGSDNMAKWQGQNLLGFTLNQVKTDLKK